jgi:Flp pilus assembly protein TadG
MLTQGSWVLPSRRHCVGLGLINQMILMQRVSDRYLHRTSSRGLVRPPLGRAGIGLIYTCIAMVVFVVFASLAVDVAHVHLVKTELQCAADAAARAGVQNATGSSWATLASTAAAYNTADGASVVLVTTGPSADRDVFVGFWDSSNNTFSQGTTPYNAVRVIARRVASRSSATNLAFTRIVGLTQMDISAEAIAYKAPGSYGLIGLNFISLGGNASASYYSNGTPGAGFGSVASNGPIHLGGSSHIQGDARPGIGYSVDAPSKVDGATIPLTTALSFPNGSASPYGPSNNDNATIPSGALKSGNAIDVNGSKTYTLPGGNYYVQYVDLASNSTLIFSGAATVYVYGYMDIKGTVQTAANVPGNLRFVLVPDTLGNPPGTINIGSSAAFYASIYAPQSAITLSGTGAIYGAVLGKSVSMTGSSDIYYDLALDPSSNLTRLVK